LTASVVDDAPVGLWGTRSVVHKSTGGLRGSRSQFLVIAQVSLRVMIGQPVRAVEDRQPPEWL
jgi:hypothetical protein